MNNRQRELLESMKKVGHVSIVEQSKIFGVAEMTIRRDLEMFENLGLAIRIHGGAISKQQSAFEMDALISPARSGQMSIAKIAVRQLVPGSVVMLNAGTTVLQVAREIAAQKIPLTIVTNSLSVAIVLYRSECQVLITGGTLRRQALDLAGPITEKNLDEYHIDTLLAGCDGADSQEGFFTKDISLAEMERKSVKIARRRIIVTETTKFGQRSLTKFADVGEISIVITDKALPNADIANLEKAGVELLQ